MNQSINIATCNVFIILLFVTKAKLDDMNKSFPFNLGISNWKITISGLEQKKYMTFFLCPQNIPE